MLLLEVLQSVEVDTTSDLVLQNRSVDKVDNRSEERETGIDVEKRENEKLS